MSVYDPAMRRQARSMLDLAAGGWLQRRGRLRAVQAWRQLGSRTVSGGAHYVLPTLLSHVHAPHSLCATVFSERRLLCLVRDHTESALLRLRTGNAGAVLELLQ